VLLWQQPGVFVAMGAKLIPANRVYKDFSKGEFRAHRWTPLCQISVKFEDGERQTIYLKLEGENPTGSVKFRTARAMVVDAEAQGTIVPGKTTLVDSTSGNHGRALAFQARERGYGCHLVVDPNCPPSTLDYLRQFGAKIDMVTERDRTGSFLGTRLQRVNRLVAENPSYYWVNQYANPVVPDIHCRETANEVWLQMKKQVGAIYVGVGTGGTLAGVQRFFHEKSPSTRVIAVD